MKPLPHFLTVLTNTEVETQQDDNRTMGRKFIIPYGLYKAQGFFNLFLAAETGFSDDDVEVARAFSDYDVRVDESAIPDGVTLIRRI